MNDPFTDNPKLRKRDIIKGTLKMVISKAVLKTAGSVKTACKAVKKYYVYRPKKDGPDSTNNKQPGVLYAEDIRIYLDALRYRDKGNQTHTEYNEKVSKWAENVPLP